MRKRIPMPIAMPKPGSARLLFFIILFHAASVLAQKHVLYQVSTLDALVGGVFDGGTTLADLARQGDFGIGTFNAVDGEMMLLDGRFYRIDGAGQVRPADLNEHTPFAAVTRFEADQTAGLDSSLVQQDFLRFTDARLASLNLFYAVKIEGTFRSVRTRSVPRQVKPYRPLTEIVKSQPVFEFENVRGVMAGFRCPAFVKGVNFAGYHLHFLTRDGKGGGHVLGFVTDRVTIGIERIDEFHLKLPADSAFFEADLSSDHAADVRKVE
jgi:acetolactate decarboxylase